MRLIERTLETVELHARTRGRGALGSKPESFVSQGVPVRASILGEGGGVGETARGLEDRAQLRLLVPADTICAVGDRVIVRGKAFEIRAIDEWTAHKELSCRA